VCVVGCYGVEDCAEGTCVVWSSVGNGVRRMC
jgi:hypothetical protein